MFVGVYFSAYIALLSSFCFNNMVSENLVLVPNIC